MKYRRKKRPKKYFLWRVNFEKGKLIGQKIKIWKLFLLDFLFNTQISQGNLYSATRNVKFLEDSIVFFFHFEKSFDKV